MQVYFKNDYTAALIDVINNTWPDRLESILNIKLRAETFRAKLIKELNQNPKKFTQQANGPKLAVVGHSVFYKVYTASPEFWESVYCSETHDVYPSDQYSLTMMNCEIHADQTIVPHLVVPKKPQVVEDTEQESTPRIRQPRLALSV